MPVDNNQSNNDSSIDNKLNDSIICKSNNSCDYDDEDDADGHSHLHRHLYLYR